MSGRVLGRLTALAGGAGLYALAFPPFDHALAAWATLLPLLLVVGDGSPLRAAAYGGVYGFLAGWAVTWWLAHSVASYFAAGIVVGALSMSAAYLAAVATTFGAFAAGAVLLRRRLPAVVVPFAVAALWTATELVRGRLLGSPWALLGYTQHELTPLLQIASVTGVYGVSFLVALGNAALADAIRTWRRGAGVDAAATSLVAPGAVVATVWLVGFMAVPHGESPSAPLRVALVQSNVPPAFHWTRGHAEEQLAANLRLTGSAASDRPDLIVWPENALTLYLEQEPLVARQLAGVARRTGADLLIGGPRHADGHTFNSARLLRADGAPGGVYDKQRLVPFAEAPLVAPVEASFDESPRAFTAGTRAGVLRSGVPLAVSICHEMVYPEVVSGGVLGGGEVLVTIANDGWLDDGSGVGSRQHFAMAVVRAVETRRWLARAATTGVSAIVDPYGRVVARMDPGDAGIVAGAVAPRRDLTPYVRFGDVFAGGCTVVSLVLVAWSLVPRSRRVPMPETVVAGA